MKDILRNNVIKFIIGMILLGVSYGYILNHPAEKASIFSGFEVLFQRMELYFYRIAGKDVTGLQTKFDLEKTFGELINTAETKGCDQKTILAELRIIMDSLKHESVADLENNMGNYKRKIGEYKTMIDAACK